MGINRIKYSNKFPLGNLGNNDNLELKISQFYQAAECYKNNPLYSRIEIIFSILILFFQTLTLVNLFQMYHGTHPVTLIVAFILSYTLTDFINGFVHMYMDNNTHYTSIVGPFIAAFHLHHANPKYSRKHPLKIYFYETGKKFWLLGYLLVLLFMQQCFNLDDVINFCLVSIGILSSIAEVSHYWCHNATKENKIIVSLQRYRILLAKQQHIHHHRSDNTHYAFLNGITDPLLNLISKKYYQGYKNYADKHTAGYKQLIQQNITETKSVV